MFRGAVRKTTPNFIVWMKNIPKGAFRATVICSKQIDKRATARNLIKRRVREILRKDIAPLFPSHGIIVNIKTGAKGKTSHELKESLIYVLTH